MENKEQIMSYIQEQLKQGSITEYDLKNLIYTEDSNEKGKSFSKNMINIFYLIGAIIVMIGVIILFAMHWTEIGFMGRILATLGVGLVGYVTALTVRSSEFRILSQVLFIVSAFLGTFGIFILLDQADIKVTLMVQFMSALIMATIFSFAYYVNRRNILPLIIIGFATWSYYTLILDIFPVGLHSFADVMRYSTMILGISYGLISYGLSSHFVGINSDDQKEKDSVSGVLYFFGIGSFLIAIISIGGFFDILNFLIIFGVFYLGVYLKRKSILLVSALSLMGHIINVSIEYFVSSVGWPIVLIFSGIAVIGIGIITHKLSVGIKEEGNKLNA